MPVVPVGGTVDDKVGEDEERYETGRKERGRRETGRKETGRN